MIARRLAVAGLLVAVQMLPAASADAKNLVTPTSRVELLSVVRTLDQLKPTQCTATPADLVIGTGGTVTGGAGNSLLLGSPVVDSMNAGKGDDCVVGGGGNDAINGGPGIDVCIGGPGTDTFTACETAIQ